MAQDSRNRIQIGDASTVFWAEAHDAGQSKAAETVIGALMGVRIDEDMQAGRVRPILEGIAKAPVCRHLSITTQHIDASVGRAGAGRGYTCKET